MPPLDLPIIKSALFELILPSFSAAAIIVLIAVVSTQIEWRRDIIAAVGLVAAIVVGNTLKQIVPFTEIETGWRSLLWATMAAFLIEPLLARIASKQSWYFFKTIAVVLSALILSIGLYEWDSRQPTIWPYALLAFTILMNWNTLTFLSYVKRGHFVPLGIAVIWGGGSAAVLVLSHSARFADLAVLLSCSLAGAGLVIAIAGIPLHHIYAGVAAFFPAVMVAGALNTYSNVPVASFVLIAIAPLLLQALRLRSVGAWFEAHPKTLILVSTLPCVVAVGLAARYEM